MGEHVDAVIRGNQGKAAALIAEIGSARLIRLDGALITACCDLSRDRDLDTDVVRGPIWHRRYLRRPLLARRCLRPPPWPSAWPSLSSSSSTSIARLIDVSDGTNDVASASKPAGMRLPLHRSPPPLPCQAGSEPGPRLDRAVGHSPSGCPLEMRRTAKGIAAVTDCMQAMGGSKMARTCRQLGEEGRGAGRAAGAGA